MELGIPLKIRQERFTLCIPRFCIYEASCPTKGARQRLVETADCFRFSPPHKRPPTTLSPAAREALEKLQRG